MNRSIRIAAAALALLACAAAASASEQLARDTGRSCTKCHDKPGSRLLTDQGKYFELARTLDGYDQLAASFGRCTACHVRQPGSMKLTRKGRQMAALVSDMEGLREWIRRQHPSPPAKP